MNHNNIHINLIAATAVSLAMALPLSLSSQYSSGPSIDEVVIENALEREMSNLNEIKLIKKEVIAANSIELTVRVNGTVVRTTELLPNGVYTATVRTNSGELIMVGSYKDENLTVPHGTHAFFHWTGQLESKGEYRNGYKYGVWKRYDLVGAELAEKVYTYDGVEEMLIRNDQASFAGPFMEVISEDKERAQF